MFSEKLGLTLLFSILIWLAATMFFVFFGSVVLSDPYQQNFFPTFLLLELATMAALYIVFVIYRKLDNGSYAVVKLGVVGSAVGLIIDTFVLWNRDMFFPGWSNEQLLAFTIWMAFAYGLYLLIPLFMRKGSK